MPLLRHLLTLSRPNKSLKAMKTEFLSNKGFLPKIKYKQQEHEDEEEEQQPPSTKNRPLKPSKTKNQTIPPYPAPTFPGTSCALLPGLLGTWAGSDYRCCWRRDSPRCGCDVSGREVLLTGGGSPKKVLFFPQKEKRFRKKGSGPPMIWFNF